MNFRTSSLGIFSVYDTGKFWQRILQSHFLTVHACLVCSTLYVGHFFHCAPAAAQCIVIGPVCLGVGGCVFVGLLPQLEIACIDHHQTGFVGKDSDHLQLIKFWPSRASGKRVCGGAKFLAPPYYSQRAMFASL